MRVAETTMLLINNKYQTILATAAVTITASSSIFQQKSYNIFSCLSPIQHSFIEYLKQIVSYMS
jgi:hypothetical protein